MILTALTCTGGRPKALGRCIHYMNRQTVKPDVWFIMDDVGDVDPVVDFAIDTDPEAQWLIDACQIMRAPWTWKKGDNTLGDNLQSGTGFALQQMGTEIGMAFIEDDDWYAPDYLEDVAQRLPNNQMVGETRSRYFNVKTGRGKQLENTAHCSMMGTAIHGLEAFEWLWHVIDSGPAYDIKLWRSTPLVHDKTDEQRTCGIKGLPGRGGIGIGHRDDFGQEGWGLLEEWIGDDADWYRQFMRLETV